VGGFDEESARLIELADRLESECGAAYFRDMPMQMRETVTELTAERAREIPLRRALAADPNLVDCVLCGFASEGHRLAKRLHCGQTFPFADRWVRATGIGPAEGFSYELASLPNQPQQLIVTVAGNGPPAPGRLRIGDQEFPLEPNAGPQLASGVDPAGSPAAPGVHDCAFPLSPSPEPRRRVWLWSTSSLPCWIATIRLLKSL
jgi:hypothetical protein